MFVPKIAEIARKTGIQIFIQVNRTENKAPDKKMDAV